MSPKTIAWHEKLLRLYKSLVKVESLDLYISKQKQGLSMEKLQEQIQELTDKVDRIEKLLERICPPLDMISVAENVRRIRQLATKPRRQS